MWKMRIPGALVLCLLLGLRLSAVAQSAARPAYILVELPTMAERMAYLEREGRMDMAAMLRAEVNYVRQLTVADWSARFQFCSVFFYDDTSRQQVIQAPELTQVLDARLEQVSIPGADLNRPHVMAFFGYRFGSSDENSPATAAYSWPRLYLLTGQGLLLKSLRPVRAARRAARDSRGQPLEVQQAQHVQGFESIRFPELVYMPVAAQAASWLRERYKH